MRFLLYKIQLHFSRIPSLQWLQSHITTWHTFWFVHHVNTETLQDLSLSKMSDPCLGHHRYRHCSHNVLYHLENKNNFYTLTFTFAAGTLTYCIWYIWESTLTTCLTIIYLNYSPWLSWIKTSRARTRMSAQKSRRTQMSRCTNCSVPTFSCHYLLYCHSIHVGKNFILLSLNMILCAWLVIIHLHVYMRYRLCESSFK